MTNTVTAVASQRVSLPIMYSHASQEAPCHIYGRQGEDDGRQQVYLARMAQCAYPFFIDYRLHVSSQAFRDQPTIVQWSLL